MDKRRVLEIIKEMMSVGGTASAPGFSQKADPKGPVAGFDPAMDLRKKLLTLISSFSIRLPAVFSA